MKKILVILITIFLCGCIPTDKNEYSETRFIMDTVCTIKAGGVDAQNAIIAAFDRINEISSITDYYSNDSEVSKINCSKANEKIILSDDMSNILSVSLEVSQKSNGAFDITVAPLKDLWNISDGKHTPPTEEEISYVLQQVGYEQLKYDSKNKTLTKLSNKCKIDLGGAAKGYAADCAADILKKYGCNYALIDLGGNIYVFGNNPSRKDGKWIVGLQKAFADIGTYSQTISLKEGAVVTAGCYQRYFEWNGTIYHHIIDPNTGYPSKSGISGASIKAENALLADCLSTACMVMGEERSNKLVSDYNVELYTEK